MVVFYVNLLNYKYSIKLVIEITLICKMRCLKKIITKLNKYFKDKNEIKYKKLEV